jgi:hypothetical protein
MHLEMKERFTGKVQPYIFRGAQSEGSSSIGATGAPVFCGRWPAGRWQRDLHRTASSQTCTDIAVIDLKCGLFALIDSAHKKRLATKNFVIALLCCGPQLLDKPTGRVTNKFDLQY